jgi:hypothetical protein
LDGVCPAVDKTCVKKIRFMSKTCTLINSPNRQRQLQQQ